MYSWVSGGSSNDGSVRKYHRAIAQLTKENKEVTEAAIKELYVKWGGLVIEREEPAAVETEEEAPKKRTRRTE